MALSLQQVQKQTQTLIMTPQMQQSIQLLQMTTLELEQLIKQEMSDNPFLELLEDEEELSAEHSAANAELAEPEPPPAPESPASALLEESAPPGAAEEPGADDSAGDTDLAPGAGAQESEEEIYSFDAASESFDTAPSEEPATFDTVDVDWDECFDGGENAAYHPTDDQEERDFTEYTATREGLYEHLERQLRLSSLTGPGQKIGEFLIGNINDDGYFDCSPAGLLALLGAPPELTAREADEKELRRFAARLTRRSVKELEGQDRKALWRLAAARLLRVEPASLAETPREEIFERLLARILDMDTKTLAGIEPRERFLLAVARRLKVSRDAVEDALDVIQEFDPTGVGARDLAECLRLQAEALNIRDRLFYQILDDHLPLLLQKKFREIAQLTGRSEAEVSAGFQRVGLLDPKPARSLTRESPRYITPDVHVKKVDGVYMYFLNEGDSGRIKLSSRYRHMAQNRNFGGKEREFAMEKLRAATWLIKNIEKRKSTILRVTEAIMEAQKEFLEKGMEYLKPLTLREIAERVGMHESTIARVTSGKYVETPRGLFELKFFFSSGLGTDEGEETSSRAIKEVIARMIEAENPKKPISDQKIATALEAQGVRIARRTVAKYREQMKILPAKLRRQT